MNLWDLMKNEVLYEDIIMLLNLTKFKIIHEW